MELATIINKFLSPFLEKYGNTLLPSQRKAMEDIRHCRTEIMGGTTYFCEACGHLDYSYHSCQNRACPKCMNDRATIWLDKQLENILPVPYFFVTFTLPAELRQLIYLHQKELYNLLFEASSKAMMKLSKDKRFVGGDLGMMAVLHTWCRDLDYHPHVHYLIPSIFNKDSTARLLKKPYLFNSKALAAIFKAKFKSGLKKLGYTFSQTAFEKNWVVHIENVGSGTEALKYLAPYIFRVALTNKRIISIKEDKVTFSYTESKSGQTKLLTLEGVAFLRRFLCHVLPKGFVKVRYYGFLQPSKKKQFQSIKLFLSALFLLLLHCDLPLKKRAVVIKPTPTCRICGGTIIPVSRWKKYESRSPPVFKIEKSSIIL